MGQRFPTAPIGTDWLYGDARQNSARIKGDQLYVEGKIRYSQYQDKNNETRYSTEIIVDDLRKLGRKADSEGILGQQASPIQQSVPQPTAASVVAEQQMEYPIADQPVDDLPF